VVVWIRTFRLNHTIVLDEGSETAKDTKNSVVGWLRNSRLNHAIVLGEVSEAARETRNSVVGLLRNFRLNHTINLEESSEAVRDTKNSHMGQQVTHFSSKKNPNSIFSPFNYKLYLKSSAAMVAMLLVIPVSKDSNFNLIDCALTI
jgi:hypothetical protein